MEACNWLKEDNEVLAWNAAVLEGQVEQAGAREELLVRGWAFWERRARILEELGWVTGAWEWIAQTFCRRYSQPLQLERPRPEVVEVILDLDPLYAPHPRPQPRISCSPHHKIWARDPYFPSPISLLQPHRAVSPHHRIRAHGTQLLLSPPISLMHAF
jgi:hypothetical protein